MDLRIQIEPGSTPIRGQVHTGDPATSRPFTGWMGLVELIATAVADMDDSAPDQGRPY